MVLLRFLIELVRKNCAKMSLIEDETEAGGLQAASAADAALRIGHTATNRKVAGLGELLNRN